MSLTFSDNSPGKVVGIALSMHMHYEETVAWSFHVLARYANSYVSYALLSFEVQVVNSHVSLLVSCILRSNPWGFQQEAGQRNGTEAEVNSISRAKLWKNLKAKFLQKDWQQGQRCLKARQAQLWHELKKRCRCIQFVRSIGFIHFWRHGWPMSKASSTASPRLERLCSGDNLRFGCSSRIYVYLPELWFRKSLSYHFTS